MGILKHSIDDIQALAERASRAADEGQYEEARNTLDTISVLYPEYPHLDAERERITDLQDKAKSARSKNRRVIGIRKALAQNDIEGTRRELQIALEEAPNDDELLGLQNELTEIENKTKEAHDLYEIGRRQVAAEEYEVGIEMFRHANKLIPNSRPVETALFNALVQFAKNIVDFEPKRARHLLDEATRLSPLNLTLESAALYLSDRIRESALNECRRRVHILRDQGQIVEALKLVNDLARKFELYDDPTLQQIQSDIWINFDPQGKSPEEAADSARQIEPNRKAGTERRIESASLLHRTREAFTAIGTWDVRGRSRRALLRVAAEGRTMRAKTHEWHKLSRSAFVRLPKAYQFGVGIICLLLIVATTLVSTSHRHRAERTSVGTATMLSSVALFREPSALSPVSGNLRIGQSVEILTQLPAMTLDAWTLIRPVDDKQVNGYTRLQNLDRIKTDNLSFDLWHAMTFLNRSSRPEELESRIENIDDLLKTETLTPSADTDNILLKLSKTVTSLAIGNHGNPESAGRLLGRAEAYLSLIAGTLQLSDEAYELKESIRKAHITIGESSSEPVPPSTRAHNEETQITRGEPSRDP